MIVTTTMYVILAVIVITWIIATEILYWKVYAGDGIYIGKVLAMVMGAPITMVVSVVGMIIIETILIWDKVFPIAIPVIIVIVIVVIMFVVNTQLYKKRQRDKK